MCQIREKSCWLIFMTYHFYLSTRDVWRANQLFSLCVLLCFIFIHLSLARQIHNPYISLPNLLQNRWENTSEIHWGGIFDKSQVMWLKGRVENWRQARSEDMLLMGTWYTWYCTGQGEPHPREHYWCLVFLVARGHSQDSRAEIGKRMNLDPQVTNRS